MWRLNLSVTLSQYFTNFMHKICFTGSFISCLYMFWAHMLIIRRWKLHYTASGIITPIGGGLMHVLREDCLFYRKFYFMPLHVSSTCAHHQEVKIALHSLWYHHTYRWPSRARVKQILCMKLVKHWDKLGMTFQNLEMIISGSLSIAEVPDIATNNNSSWKTNRCLFFPLNLFPPPPSNAH